MIKVRPLSEETRQKIANSKISKAICRITIILSAIVGWTIMIIGCVILFPFKLIQTLSQMIWLETKYLALKYEVWRQNKRR